MDFNYKLVSHKIKEYKKGEIIKNEGDLCDAVGLISFGIVTISNITINNTEYLIDRLKQGDLFGENLIFSENNYYPGNIIASQQTKIIFLSKENFMNLLSKDVNFQEYYLKYISTKFISLHTRIKILSQPKIKDKFLYYLQSEMTKTKKDFIIIESISVLSTYLNVPRPSLSRTISKLIKENFIIKKKKIYSIDKKHHNYP